MKLDTTRPVQLVAAERAAGLEIRPLMSHDDLRACVALQRRTWGEDFRDIVPASILKIGARLGGIAAGAFDSGGTLVGFVFGFTGVYHEAIVHWSHMLGVAPEAQNRGIGRKLKEYQRAHVATLGATMMYWTFDPLVARNAHLNVNVLGVSGSEYVRDMYGDSASPLHRGIGTDRLIVSWTIDDAALAARRAEIASASSGRWSQSLRIEIPGDIAALQASNMSDAQAWRERTRAAFMDAFSQGLTLKSFEINPQTHRGSYLLAR